MPETLFRQKSKDSGRFTPTVDLLGRSVYYLDRPLDSGVSLWYTLKAMSHPIITFIGPWTFIYGILFAGFALGLDRIRAWLGVGLLLVSSLLLKDIPGSFCAASIYLLFQRGKA